MTPEDEVLEEQEVPTAYDLVSGESKGPSSLMDQLRLKRTEIAETRSTQLTIPGYEETGLLVEHRLMNRREMQDIGKRVSRETKDRGERNMRILLEMIIDSTSGFYRQNGDGESAPLPPPNEEEGQVVIWSELATYIGWDGNDGERGAIRFMFGNNEFAIAQYGFALNRWMSNTSSDVDTEFLGEGV